MISNKILATLFLVAFVFPVIFASNTPKSGLLDKFICKMKKLVPRFGTRKITTPPLTTDNTVELVKIQEKNPEFPDDTQGSSPSNKLTLKKRQGRTSKPREVLVDTTNDMNPVEVQKESTGVISTLQELSAPQADSPFKILIKQGEYNKIFELGEKMYNDEFMKQLCPVVETLEQYNRVVDYLKKYKLVASFYVYGNTEVVKGAVAALRVYEVNKDYVYDGDLETALPLALEKDRHDRAMELFDARKRITAEDDEQRKLDGRETSFESFVYRLLDNLAPWLDGMALRRFFILNGDELKNKYHDILDTFCETLVRYLSGRFHFPSAGELLVDLIGQPSLLKPAVFAREFLYYDDDVHDSAFIRLGWREAIEEGLKKKYGHGKELWQVMQAERPEQFAGEFPVTEEALAAVLKHFPTKQQKEEQWIRDNAAVLHSELESESLPNILPNVLWSIVSEYAVLLAVTWNLTTSTK